MTYDTWKTTNPADAELGPEPFFCEREEHGGIHCARDGWPDPCPDCAAEDRPCNWEKFSGECMVCGAGIDEECEWERERR